MENIVIIGNGISGVTAARHIRKKSDVKITIISGETDYFFSRTALMYIYMGHMKFEHTQPYESWFWEKNRIDLVKAYVKQVDFGQKKLTLDNESTISYDKLILATGSKPNKFGLPGQYLKGVGGLYSYQDLENMETYTNKISRAVVVGGGLIGIEMVEMLLSRDIPVTFLVREKSFWNNVLPAQESELINKHIKTHHVDLRLGSELKEILPDENGRARAIVTSDGEEIACEWVGLTAGVSPNISFLKDSDLKTDKGIIVNRYFETNIEGVYAIGDCAQFEEAAPGRRSLEQVWYTGRIMGEIIAKTITGEKTLYNPGHWFNSAKFFDIEYQTYGWVFPQLKDGQADFYWEHPEGKKCMHFVFEENSRKLIGVNTFGVRLRHHCFDGWLTEERSIEYVLEHLKDANFDPEFYKKHESAIVSKFNQENATTISPKSKSWNRILKFVKS